MGFYGNIADRANEYFKFDRIFSSRYEMDAAAAAGTDNVFAGHFVLVQYDPNGQIFSGDFYAAYIDTSTGIAYADELHTEPLYFTPGFTEVLSPTPENWASYWIQYNNGFYVKVGSQDEVSTSGDITYYTATSNGDKANLTWVGRIIREKDSDGYTTDKYFVCTQGNSNNIGLWSPVINYEDTGLQYFENYNIDRQHYGTDNFILGYDATVWEKIFVNGKGTFQLIAHLNGMMPGIKILADPPSDVPLTAYIDSLSNDGLYRIHVPSHWGFRIKEVEQGDTSDQKVLQTYHTYNAQNEVISTIASEIDADIYFNKAGADKDHRVVDTTTPNEILISSDGESGKTYYNSDGTLVTKDTKELSIHMPAVGNMIAHGYDLIYGVSGDGLTRYPNIMWYDASASEVAKTQGDAIYGLKTHDLNTIAGSLNTIHDRLGQIVYHLEDDISDTQAAALPTRFIYEKGGRYYRIGTKYRNEEVVYDPNDPNSMIQYRSVSISQEDYVGNKYYILQNGSYVPASRAYDSNTTYYLRYINGIRYTPITLLQFQPNTYYLHEGDDWICDNSSLYPIYPTRKYYQDIQVSEPRTFTSQYFADGSFFTLENDYDYIKSYDPTPELNTTYYYINQAVRVIQSNTLCYVKNVFYNKKQDGTFELLNGEPNEIDYTKTYYVLTFSPVSQVGLDQNGNPIMYYAKTGETAVALVEPPANLQDLYFQDDDGNWISYKHLETYPVQDGLNPYTVGRDYFALTVTGYLNDLYLPNVYYTKNTDSSSSEYLSYYKATGNLITGQQYYAVYGGNEVLYQFYLPEMYWYEFAQDDFALATEPSMVHNQYYEKATLYAKDENRQFPDWYEWNDYVPYIPPSVSLYTREEYTGLVEIRDFENNNNSINGMILNLSRAYDLNDEYTRDTRTYRGVFNKINDLLYQIHILKPGQLLYVNDYGQIDSLPKSVDATSDYYNYKKLKELYARVATIEQTLGIT